MSGTTITDDSVWLDDPPSSLSWRSWPLGQNILGGSILLISLSVAGMGVHFVTGQIHLALLAAAVLAIALWRFFLPVAFELNADGVNQWLFGRHKLIPWRAIRRYEVYSSGVLLLPFYDGCVMDAFRGLHLPWGDHRDEVLAHLHYYLDRPRD